MIRADRQKRAAFPIGSNVGTGLAGTFATFPVGLGSLLLERDVPREFGTLGCGCAVHGELFVAGCSPGADDANGAITVHSKLLVLKRHYQIKSLWSIAFILD
jgi:hypothetical protein